MRDVGVDIVEIARVKAAVERHGAGFRRRVYTELEWEQCGRSFPSLAGRFAAKEAVMKALGRGWGSKVSWSNIEVARARNGKPEIVLHNHTSAFAEKLGIRRLLVSITHTNEHALAYVLAQDD